MSRWHDALVEGCLARGTAEGGVLRRMEQGPDTTVIPPCPCSLRQKGHSRMSRQSRTELLKTAVVDRAIRAPSNERNRETGPTAEIQVRHADLAHQGRLHAAPRRHRIVLPPGSDRRLLGPCCSKQICNRPSSIRFHRTGHGKVMLGPLLSSVMTPAGPASDVCLFAHP